MLNLEHAEVSDLDRATRRVLLLAITAQGLNHYRLDFVDWGAPVSFVLERMPRTGGVRISDEFSRHFEGLASAHEAFKAIDRFARGEAVELPIEIAQDGGPQPCWPFRRSALDPDYRLATATAQLGLQPTNTRAARRSLWSSCLNPCTSGSLRTG
jgi:hypothetical protein